MIVKQPTELLTPTEAKAQGLKPLTWPFKIIDGERTMRETVLADMRRGGIKHALVGTELVHEIWRTPV